MKTPEEIKKGLECCLSVDALACCKCPYSGNGCGEDEELKDALAYIQQLERERDAAVEDLKDRCYTGRSMCCYCKNYSSEHFCESIECDDGEAFEWRGLEVER